MFQNNKKHLDPSYKTDLDYWKLFGIFSFPNDSENLDLSGNLDLSYKMSINFRECFGRETAISLAENHKTNLSICSNF